MPFQAVPALLRGLLRHLADCSSRQKLSPLMIRSNRRRLKLHSQNTKKIGPSEQKKAKRISSAMQKKSLFPFPVSISILLFAFNLLTLRLNPYPDKTVFGPRTTPAPPFPHFSNKMESFDVRNTRAVVSYFNLSLTHCQRLTAHNFYFPDATGPGRDLPRFLAGSLDPIRVLFVDKQMESKAPSPEKNPALSFI